MRQIQPGSHVRGDLTAKNAILHEIEKSVVLNRKFCWRCVLTKTQPMHVDVDLDTKVLTDAVQDVLATQGVNRAGGGLRQELIFDGNSTKAVTWIYVPSDQEHPGIAFALGVHSNTRGSQVTAYGILDPSLLSVAQDADPREHNRQVKDAWTAYVNSAESR